MGYIENPESENYNMVLIPSLVRTVDGSERVVSVRYRNLNGGDGPKYLGQPGIKSRLFNPRALHDDADVIHVTEGEFDAIILSQCGLTAVAVSGSTQWSDKGEERRATRWTLRLKDYERVYIWGDNDRAGKEFTREVCRWLPNGIGVSVGAAGQDVTDLYLTGGADAILEAVQ